MEMQALTVTGVLISSDCENKQPVLFSPNQREMSSSTGISVCIYNPPNNSDNLSSIYMS